MLSCGGGQDGVGSPSRGLTGRETASARSGPPSPLGLKIGGEEKGLMLQVCHRASTFISRFNTRERRFILTHFIESIPSTMAKLLDCYGNCWEKRFLSVSLHTSSCGEKAAQYACTGPKQVGMQWHDVHPVCAFKNKFLRHLTYILHVLALPCRSTDCWGRYGICSAFTDREDLIWRLSTRPTRCTISYQ